MMVLLLPAPSGCCCCCFLPRPIPALVPFVDKGLTWFLLMVEAVQAILDGACLLPTVDLFRRCRQQWHRSSGGNGGIALDVHDVVVLAAAAAAAASPPGWIISTEGPPLGSFVRHGEVMWVSAAVQLVLLLILSVIWDCWVAGRMVFLQEASSGRQGHHHAVTAMIKGDVDDVDQNSSTTINYYFIF
jgi:hypothetical protein